MARAISGSFISWQPVTWADLLEYPARRAASLAFNAIRYSSTKTFCFGVIMAGSNLET
jgi:hypothetical protein